MEKFIINGSLLSKVVSANKINIVIIESDQLRIEDLLARLKPFKYSVTYFKDLSLAMQASYTAEIYIIIVNINLLTDKSVSQLSVFKNKYFNNISMFIYSDQDVDNKEFYYAHGVCGFFDKYFDVRTLMNAVRRGTMPLQLLWQLTLNYNVIDSVQFSGKSFDELQNRSDLSFGQGGFCTKITTPVKFGERIAFKFESTENNKQNQIHGIGVVRWQNSKTKWTGIEIESLQGNGTDLFVQWLEKNQFIEFIPPKVA